jgi:DNA-binding MurR/RpiR family transcriptional regulator
MQTVLAELRTVAEGIDPLQVETACQMIADAGRIMLYGCGREGLQIQGFAMRLHHLGKLVSMQGDMAAPPMMPGKGRRSLGFVSYRPSAVTDRKNCRSHNPCDRANHG